MEAASGGSSPAIWVAKAETVGEEGNSVGTRDGSGMGVKMGPERGVLVKTGAAVEEGAGRGRGVSVKNRVAVGVVVGVVVLVEVPVTVAEGLGVTMSQPSLRLRNIMYPKAATRTRTSRLSTSFRILYRPKLTCGGRTSSMGTCSTGICVRKGLEISAS